MPDPCPCEDVAAQHTEFAERRDLGCDETNGRFADVTIERCRTCGRLWLHYFVEGYFENSGRWARCLIDEQAARTMTPELAGPFIDAAPWHLCGGTYFGGFIGRRSGPIRWWDSGF